MAICENKSVKSVVILPILKMLKNSEIIPPSPYNFRSFFFQVQTLPVIDEPIIHPTGNYENLQSTGGNPAPVQFPVMH